MKIKQDQPLIDLQEKVSELLIENLRLNQTVFLQRNELRKLKEASEDVIVYYHSVDHKYEQFKRKIIKLKHLIT